MSWTPEREAALVERLERATKPRPWKSTGHDQVPRVHEPAVRVTRATVIRQEDAALLEHAPQDLADLLTEVRRLRALVPDGQSRTDGWFSHGPDGIEWHDHPQEAERAAGTDLGFYRREAEDGGWEEDYVESICWGEVRARAVVVSRSCRGCGATGTPEALEHDLGPEDEECSIDDETADYGLRPVRGTP